MAQLLAEGGQWLVEGMYHDKLLIARAVVTPSANRVPIRIANTSAMPVTLYRGMKVATAESVTEANIDAVVELSSHECQDTVCNLEEVTCLYLVTSQQRRRRNLSTYLPLLRCVGHQC